MSNYRKTMTEALREMYPLDEATIDKVKEIASKKQAMKIDGVMVDSFTASAISQIYDKVNDANKKKMEKLPITKLANLAMKMMQKNEFVPEEVDLDEVDRSTYSDRMKKYTAMLKDAEKEKPLDKEWIKLLKRRIKSESDDERKKLGIRRNNREEVDLEEGKLGDQWQKGAKSVKSGSFELVRGKSGVHDIMKSGKKIGTFSYDDEGDNFVANMKGERGQLVGNDIDTLISNFKEEVDLDEGKMNNATMQANKPRIEKAKKLMGPSTSRKEAIQMVAKGMPTSESEATKLVDTVIKMMLKNDYVPEEVDLDEGKQKPYVSSDSDGKHVMGASGKIVKSFKDMDSANAYLKKNYNELMKEAELDEGKMSQLHQYIKDKKSAEEIAKLMKVDVKTIKALMSSHHPEDVDEASAYADARRSMSKDKDFSRKDSADDDTDASADDVKGASKNIMMQMRKAQSLNGRFDVEFGDGKKVKIPAKMAIAVQQKYNAQKRPAEKEKFQAKIGKSYKDMLSALKEELQPQKESILERMNRKLKENKDG